MRAGLLKTQSRRRSQWLARARQVAAIVVIGILCAAGLRATFASNATSVPNLQVASKNDLAAESFAEAFARAYLTWDGDRPEQHEQQVAGFISSALEAGAGFTPPHRGAQSVLWTAAIHDVRLRKQRRLITIAAQTTGPLYYLSVSVERDRNGFLFVPGYPALVGPPATNTEIPSGSEEEVADVGLRAIVRRAVANYLAREEPDLRADLHPRAVVSMPTAELEVRSTDAVTWAAPNRVAVEAQVREGGSQRTLRYELDVIKRDRWYVRSIQVNPTGRRR
jgi:hypothetical protein